MQRYNNTILARGTGLALQDALVTVYETGTTTKATIYSENDTESDELANPLTTDSFGMIDGYFPDGVYDLRIDHGSYPSHTIEEVQIFDLSEISAFLDDDLSPLATVNGNANQIAYFSGDGIVDVVDFTQKARDLLDDTSFAEMRQTLGIRESFVICMSDEVSSLIEGDAKVTMRWPYAFVPTVVRADVVTAPTDSAIEVDVKVGGVSIFDTTLTIDAGETTSATAAVPAVLEGDAEIADNAVVTFDLVAVGSGTPGAGLKVTIIGYQSE